MLRLFHTLKRQLALVANWSSRPARLAALLDPIKNIRPQLMSCIGTASQASADLHSLNTELVLVAGPVESAVHDQLILQGVMQRHSHCKPVPYCMV